MKVRVHFFITLMRSLECLLYTFAHIYLKDTFLGPVGWGWKKVYFLGVQKFVPNLGQLIFKRGYIFSNSNIVWYVIFYRQNKMASSNYQKKDGRKVPILGRPKIGTSIFFFFFLSFLLFFCI